ncbi:aminotransferase class IV family protein [Aliirhizobium cellulosilyticum]|jgi:4-amino-4-deoxychorismate lyase|uniref:Probable branched-chain-amino-acid aminotransferase n=1 Tax=Aliirhizobium cellulosilyticum TaxID=393664 RepID=A0A7W6S468_9HYPH|nr:aminotransferase class IV family protein [Rhizobium cellulosilyticum]MBB4346754.1 4-amino-4-deoxychorismate lyase [Rhizobium cellulosilyticum]MBB4410852.1 4-amino-4-deoxychorismate lyase [Rhizobium cellulosilyticum]MBB4445540.1 4-amino-4-deoxychorismate lyase [Rhizobium cellulosilyticum]
MDFSLIETMRWTPEDGFVRLEQHLRRLSRSADALGFRQPQDARRALDDAVDGDEPLRVRLVMSFRGKIEVTTAPFVIQSPETVWKVRIGTTKLKSDDPLYRHKTSRREPYEAARAEFSADEADEVLLTNERGEMCEGTITNLFVEDQEGMLMTPPITSGILPGVLRADLIRERRAKGAVLKPADLQEAMTAGRKIFVGNSLRGLIRAELL